MPSVMPLHYYTQNPKNIFSSINFSYNNFNNIINQKSSTTNDKQPSNNTFFKGLLSGLIGAFVVYPIDVVKTRMQNQNKSVEKIYKNGLDCWSKLWKQEGIKPFYRGCFMQLLGVGPEKAVKLFAYNHIVKNNQDDIKTQILGGLTAGTCQVFITSPYEMIKINLQMNKKINYNELFNIKKIYRGASACFLRDIPFSGIYFPTYWYLKDKQNLHPFVAGTIAGIPAAFLCTPADVLKTRMQTIQTNTFTNQIKMIYYNEGFVAFWKGAGWRVFRSSPQFGVTLYIFEKLN
jgi:solute carrier family 25 aspartate/glutamate transporter 12/13